MQTGEILYLAIVIATFVAFSGTLLMTVMAYDRHKASRAGTVGGGQRAHA